MPPPLRSAALNRGPSVSNAAGWIRGHSGAGFKKRGRKWVEPLPPLITTIHHGWGARQLRHGRPWGRKTRLESFVERSPTFKDSQSSLWWSTVKHSSHNYHTLLIPEVCSCRGNMQICINAVLIPAAHPWLCSFFVCLFKTGTAHLKWQMSKITA